MCPEFKTPSSQVLQNVVFALHRAYKMFFTKRAKGDTEVRPPNFKSRKYFFTQEYSQPNTCFCIVDGYLRLAYGSKKTDWLSIPLPPMGSFKPQTVKISRDKRTSKWYASFTYHVAEASLRQEGEVIYFDPGCKTSLTGLRTDGKFFEYDFNALRKMNFSTYKLIDELKNRNTVAWKRLHKRISDLFSKINTRTKTYLHTLANEILKDHPDVRQFRVGDWDKRETLADTGYAIADKANRAVQNNNPIGKLIEILTYKAKRNGQEVDKFDERGSTRTCAHCDGVKSKGLPPAERRFHCEKCGFEYSRDHRV